MVLIMVKVWRRNQSGDGPWTVSLTTRTSTPLCFSQVLTGCRSLAVGEFYGRPSDRAFLTRIKFDTLDEVLE
jgi:hypothetical protein